MTTVLDIQRRLSSLGFNPGPLDGDIGPATLGAMNTALDVVARTPIAKPAEPPKQPGYLVVPLDWMPWCKMHAIVVHWPVGRHKASKADKDHYHVLIEGDANLVRGTKSILDNVSTADGVYAAHTRNFNTGVISVAMCGMIGAQERPFIPGPEPITQAELDMLPRVLADLCRRYAINVTPETVLSHAEVEPTLGIKQAGKWDIAWVPGMDKPGSARVIGDKFRAATKALL